MSHVEEYRKMTDLHSRLPVFYQPWWLDTVCKKWDILLTQKDGQVTAVFPYRIEKVSFFQIIRNPLLTPYLGPYFIDNGEKSSFKKLNQEEQLFEELWQQLPAYDSCNIDTHPNFKNFLLLRHKGFSNTNRITYRIDLHRDETAIFNEIQSSHRKRIQQASQLYTIQEGTTLISSLESLHQQTFSRKGKGYIYPKGFLHKIVTDSYANAKGTLLAAVDADGAVHGTIFTAYDNEASYLLLSAADVAKSHKGVVCLLIWEAIKTAQKKGLRYFDFEGSMDAGIEPFFRRFGGERTFFTSFEHQKSRLWKLKRTLLG